MKKRFLQISIAVLILVIGIGAVSAAQSNSTDDIASVEQNDAVSIGGDDSVAVESENGDVLSASGEDVMAFESEKIDSVSVSDGVVLSVEDNRENAVSVRSDDSVLTVDAKDEKLAGSSAGKTVYKTFALSHVKIPKKFYKFEKGYVPSKKNTKMWKLYKSYQNYYKKYGKKMVSIVKKTTQNSLIKIYKNNWKQYSDVFYRVKSSGQYVIFTIYMKFYKTY